MIDIADHMNRDWKDKIKEMIKDEGYTLFSAVTDRPLCNEKFNVIAVDMDGYPFTCECTKVLKGTIEEIVGIKSGGRIVNLVAWKHISY